VQHAERKCLMLRIRLRAKFPLRENDGGGVFIGDKFTLRSVVERARREPASDQNLLNIAGAFVDLADAHVTVNALHGKV
jgi:hypothetical protein